MIRNIILAGVGGQGILLAAKVISQAAIAAGLEVTTNEIHGMAQRGGSVIAQVRYGKGISSPLILEGTADVLASLEMIEAIRYAHYLSKDGLAVVSAQKLVPVTVSSGKAVYPEDVESRLRSIFPNLILEDFAAEARRRNESRLVNTLMLGALSRGLDLSREHWLSGLKACMKPHLFEMNAAAFLAARGEA